MLFSDVDQLNRILEVVGFPEDNLLQQINDDARAYLERMNNHPHRIDFREYFHEIKSSDGK